MLASTAIDSGKFEWGFLLASSAIDAVLSASCVLLLPVVFRGAPQPAALVLPPDFLPRSTALSLALSSTRLRSWLGVIAATRSDSSSCAPNACPHRHMTA